MNKEWKMIASDVDDESIDWARKNIERNQLDSRILLRKVLDEDRILIDLLEKVSSLGEEIDFVMCNPPFFKNESELAGVTSKIRKPTKRHAPNSANPIQPNESIFDQVGEVGFVKRIVDDSLLLGKKIK